MNGCFSAGVFFRKEDNRCETGTVLQNLLWAKFFMLTAIISPFSNTFVLLYILNYGDNISMMLLMLKFSLCLIFILENVMKNNYDDCFVYCHNFIVELIVLFLPEFFPYLNIYFKIISV